MRASTCRRAEDSGSSAAHHHMRWGRENRTRLFTESLESRDKFPLLLIKVLCSFVGWPMDATGYVVIPITAATGNRGGTLVGVVLYYQLWLLTLHFHQQG